MEALSAQEAEKLIEQYGHSVYRFALSLTKHKDVADDVFQEVFLRYLKKQPVFENEEHAKAWFFVVTRNCCKNHFMSAFVRHSAPLIEDIPMLKEEKYGLYEEVLKLPLKYRQVIHLYYYEGYSSQEIASILHLPDATIRTQLKRARNLLKKQLEGCEEFENL
ncbi:RNA polymerase sigma factor [Amedibacillus sp. YH-ame6]